MKATVIGYNAEPTNHFRKRLRQRLPLSDYDRAELDIINRIKTCDCTLIGRGKGCKRLKVLLHGLFPVEVRVVPQTGKMLTVFPYTIRRRKR